MSDATDEAVARAVEAAARTITRAPDRDSFLERLVEKALVRVWPETVPGGAARARVTTAIPAWDPQPGGVDVICTFPGDAPAQVAMELKVFDVEQALWDMFKLVSLLEFAPDARAAYLVVASTPGRWDRAEVADVFAPDQTRTWQTLDLFDRWEKSWAYLLGGGRARPRDLPAAITTSFVGQHPVAAFPEYELRCVRVAAAEPCGRVAVSEDGWPGVRFGLVDLVEAAWRAPDGGDDWADRRDRLTTAFGIDLARPPAGVPDDALRLLERLQRQEARVGNPLGAMDEAVPELSRTGAELEQAAEEFRKRLCRLGADVVATGWGVDRSVRVTAEEAGISVDERPTMQR